MKLKNIGLALGISTATLIGACKKENTKIILPEFTNQTILKTRQYVRNDTVFTFFNQFVKFSRKENGIDVTDTITGYLRACDSDVITFITYGKNAPEKAVKIGSATKEGKINFIY